MIVVGVYTVGRRAYLEETLESFRAMVTGPISRLVFFDDSGDPEFRAWLETMVGPEISVASWGRNRGFTESVARSWDWLATHAVEDHVFHLEEDFLFDRPVDLGDLVEVLEADDRLDQVALLRGAYFPSEIRAGGVIEVAPEEHFRETIAGRDVVTQTRIFTTNPSIYRRSLCRVGWPREARSEAVFSRNRRLSERTFAYLGDGTPWISHIGAERAGRGGY